MDADRRLCKAHRNRGSAEIDRAVADPDIVARDSSNQCSMRFEFTKREMMMMMGQLGKAPAWKINEGIVSRDSEFQ